MSVAWYLNQLPLLIPETKPLHSPAKRHPRKRIRALEHPLPQSNQPGQHRLAPSLPGGHLRAPRLFLVPDQQTKPREGSYHLWKSARGYRRRVRRLRCHARATRLMEPQSVGHFRHLPSVGPFNRVRQRPRAWKKTYHLLLSGSIHVPPVQPKGLCLAHLLPGSAPGRTGCCWACFSRWH